LGVLHLPKPEELETKIALEEDRIPPPVMFPPRTSSSTALHNKRNKQNGSVGGAKEPAFAITLFY
jgi:hypothetical protein